MEAYQKTSMRWKPGFPIIVDSRVQQSAITSPEALQKMLGLSKTPVLSTTRLTRRAGDRVGEEVTVAEMDVFAFDSLPRFATTTKTYVFFPDASMKSVVPMDATIITSVRETPVKKNDKWRCWSEAVAAFNRGERMPEPRYPIMIRKPGEETPLTAERLQKLVQLPVVPEVTKAPISDSLDGEDDMEVEIAKVSRGEWLLLCERTEFDSSECILFFDRETGETAKRSVMTVESIHDKWLASIEWEESVERGEYEDEGTSVSSE